MTNYKSPILPTQKSAQDNPALLKKLPSRWQKNATVLACLGVIGTMTLAGCTSPAQVDDWPHNGGAASVPYYVVYPTEQETDAEYETEYGTEEYEYEEDSYEAVYGPIQETPEQLAARLTEAELESRIHHGGAGAGPFYTVHITEQEVLGFIRAKLESAGLNLSATPPDYIAGEYWSFGGQHALDLHDAEKGIAVSHLSWVDSNRAFSPTRGRYAEEIKNMFADLTDMPIGVFYNPGVTVSTGRWIEEGDEWVEELDDPTPEAVAEAREEIIENLTAQVQEFINWLRNEGIL